MFRRFAARFMVGTSVLFLAMAGGSSAWAQYGDHYGHGHPGFGRNGTTTGSRGLPPGYQPFPYQALPNRTPVARNWAYFPPTPGPVVKPFSNYRPAPPIDWRKYQSRRR